MKNLLQQLDFGNEAGDDVEQDELKSYFIEQSAFRPFLQPKYRIRLATAKKGVGKSALLQWLNIQVSEEDPEALVIFLKGKDLVRTNFVIGTAPTTPNEYINDWITRICCVVARQLGQELKIAFSDDSMALIEASELSGVKSRSIVSAVIDRLKLKGLLELDRSRPEPGNYEALLARALKKKVWILVDDLDATYQRTDKENLELSTFFSACRDIVRRLSGVYFRVTMRTDVWPMIRRYDEALDKMDQYVQDITWSESDFRCLLFKRIAAQILALGITLPAKPAHVSEEEEQEYYINVAFEKRMRWGEFERRSYKILYTLSYQRPRWAIQLCKAAQTEANIDKSLIITRDHLDRVWGNYGKKRIADLVAEHKHQCKNVEELISAFRGAERKVSREALLVWVKNRITNHMTPVIEGVATKQPIEVAHFLYRIGFIVARSESGDEYEHYHFSDMPDFLSSRTNDDFGVFWEIHPCYREALDIVKLNRWKKRGRE